ncbi:hybrid sensor histidine kinase/response regulator [Massilia glaciei]|uniref:Virulence sensor protein BvgS n=2 Tax=Massilia glaciei TaxID=1524097 RepID=A0A2U2HEA0_9BURK|nr:hybrid sensor histidine kinase/response regulator [Massilia glaciei]
MLMHAGAAHAAPGDVVLGQAQDREMLPDALLYLDNGEHFPAAAGDVAAWQATLKPAAKVDLLGGSYWMVVNLRNYTDEAAWVLDPRDTLIEKVEARLLGSDGTVQTLHTGYRAKHEHFLHYGKNITLNPSVSYQLALRFSSPYYARMPVISVTPEADYIKLVDRENLLIIGSLGALLALAIFNFFIYSITRDRASLWYSVYVLTYATAWAMTFHVTADLFGWRVLELHYVPFFLLPVFSTLFYLKFLRLDQLAPRLAKISVINLVLPLVLLPSCFFALSWAHTLATIAISIWMLLALICGIVAWRKGYQPARFFVFAFVALMLPGFVILPANVGLIPAMVDNAQLLTLLGGTLDGLLLAFALADQIRLLRDNLEQRVQERTSQLLEVNQALTLAKDHAEVVSRHRIDFLSAMSHDIRTPLAGVIGMLKFALRDQTVHGRTKEYLRIGLHNGESLLAILNDLLDFSKIDAGKLTLETVSFRLDTVLDDALGILQTQADAKSLLLECGLRHALPEYVAGDPTRLRQILINLLGNAIKFTEAGRVRLDLIVGASDANQTLITFSITDSGPGIGKETCARLFQKFEQADLSTTRRYGGSGLGLAICKELVTLMKGTIGVESEVGVGSRFHFTLPLAIGIAPPQPESPKVRERHSHQLRVLCAEDVRTNQIIIGTLLENMGHRVQIAENGLEALRALSADDFDLVLMDGRMPLMDGEQATRLIRCGGTDEARVRDPAITVVALTANVSGPDCARYLAAGMDGFLSKPVNEALLYDQIENTIRDLLGKGVTLKAAQQQQQQQQQAPDREAELALQFGVARVARAPALPKAEPPDGVFRIVPLPGVSPQHMDKITQAFIEEAPRRLALAREALLAGDAGVSGAAFHALKGSAGYFNCSQLHELATRLESLCSRGALEGALALLPQLENAVARAIADLRSARVDDLA